MIKYINGILFYVADLDKSVAFYRSLGAEIIDHSDSGAMLARFSEFDVDLVDEKKAHFMPEASVQPRGGGMFLYFEVDDVDAWHQKMVALGHKPSSEPKDWPWGNREFVLRDPDGYKLVFYKSLK